MPLNGPGETLRCHMRASVGQVFVVSDRPRDVRLERSVGKTVLSRQNLGTCMKTESFCKGLLCDGLALTILNRAVVDLWVT